ncbi:hypothetical protein [Amycolatopsis thermophila]|uniref:Uncharacterized protein n=1 Tax=Amycolatopsis thermophila TaxID=206084 RepID=A0ABU0EMK7_9PSEU|nr:hypothetical protein [Amycolatopsis thermophila]MDQ0376497.1 hypothetical protein [Amycolatopsis thermophila]
MTTPGGAFAFACDWGVVADPCCPGWEEAEPAERERASKLAVFLLWAATGRQYGRCEVTIRPCRRGCTAFTEVRGVWQGNRWTPLLQDGQWFNIECGCNQHRCSCTEVCEIELPGWLPEPVRVHVDGQDVPLVQFRVDDGRRLVWEANPDGACFPLCQDLSKPLGQPGTWAVTYKHGLPVPPGGEEIAGELACELLKACTPGMADQCRLPDNVKRVTRENVEYEFDAAASGDFGVFSINQWVKAVNPYGLVAPPQIYSPDVVSPVVTTWP